MEFRFGDDELFRLYTEADYSGKFPKEVVTAFRRLCALHRSYIKCDGIAATLGRTGRSSGGDGRRSVDERASERRRTSDEASDQSRCAS